jgi:hypothetical protein
MPLTMAAPTASRAIAASVGASSSNA